MSTSNVRVLRNTVEGAQQPHVVVPVPGNLNELYKLAGKKLGITVKYAYLQSGVLVDDVSLLRDDELIFCGDTEGFYKNAAAAESSKTGSTVKISIMGPGGSGKSCITIRYTKSTFVETYDPTIEDAFRHQTTVDDAVCIMEILDTAGQEEFKCLAQQWVENKQGFLLVYNVVENTSVLDAESFFRLICDEYECHNTIRPPVILVANKIDLVEQRKITTAMGEEAARQWGVEGYVETSARTGENIDLAFSTLVRAIRKQQKPKGPAGASASSSARPAKPAGGGGGCTLI